MKKLKDYTYYLFDADGTLIDTKELIYQSFSHVYKSITQKEISRETIYAGIGKPLKGILMELFPQETEEQIKEIMQTYKEYQLSITSKYISLFPGVLETLNRLKEQKKRMVIVTSRLKESLLFIFKKLEITDFFEFFITPESTTEHKPSPEPAFEAMKLLGASKEECLFIGDARWDIQCAHSAGIASCLVNWSHDKMEDFPIKPDVVIKHPLDLTR